jgi:N-acetylglucosamine kinase-like BadF-type ATPase
MVRSSRFVLAVDGGQSSTLAMLAATDGRVLGAGLAGPSNHAHEPGGIQRLEGALRQSIERSLEAANCTADKVSHVCLGMTGAVSEAKDFAMKLFPNAEVQAHVDMVTALAGASIARPGVVVIAGTGSIAYGRLDDGRDARVGGWGYLFGDEGSAYSIGRAALQVASQAVDGRRGPTALTGAIPAAWGLPSMLEVREAIYGAQIARPQIAGLAAVVTQLANQGDLAAAALLADAGRSLAEMAYAVIVRLGALEDRIPVFTTGGVFRAGSLVLTPFYAILHARSALVHVEDAAFSPIVGALFMAFQAAGIDLNDDLVQRVRASLPSSAISKHQDSDDV